MGELWNRSVTIVTFVLVGLLLGASLVGALLMRYPRTAAQQTPADEPQLPPVRTLPQTTSRAIALRSMELSQAYQRIAELEQQAEPLRKEIARLKNNMQQMQALVTRLRNERDTSVELLQVFSTPATTEIKTTDLPAEPVDRTPFGAEDVLNLQRQIEMEDMAQQLVEMRTLLDDMQQQAAADIESLRQELLRMEQLASNVAIRAGTSAITPLIELLESPRVADRVWAANTLRVMGPDAASAIPALTLATHDTEEPVRQAASAALSVIRD